MELGGKAVPNSDKYDYRKELKRLLKSKKKLKPYITLQKMASHIGVQSPYLSKVLSEHSHMNQDQLYLACDYLGLDEEESRILFLMHSYSRSVVPIRKTEIAEELEGALRKRLRTEKFLEAKEPDPAAESWQEFFLDPYLQIVHRALDIKKFQRNPQLLVKEGLVSESKLAEVLEKLTKMGLVYTNKKEHYLSRENTLYLKRSSPLLRPQQNMLKLMGLQKLQMATTDQAYSYAMVFSSNVEVKQEIQKKFMQFLKEAGELIDNGGEEELYQFNFELFPWTGLS